MLNLKVKVYDNLIENGSHVFKRGEPSYNGILLEFIAKGGIYSGIVVDESGDMIDVPIHNIKLFQGQL